MDRIKINEVFFSIQGESTLAGCPTVFIRTSGCHLRCYYCDTTYAYHNGKFMTISEVLSQVVAFKAKYVCLTGGEPLLQKPSYKLLKELCDLNLTVSLETSGDLNCWEVDPRVKKIIDIKTPDSGAEGSFCKENLIFRHDSQTEFKFVICSERDFEWSERFVRQENLGSQATVLYSPSFGKVNEKWLAKKILSVNSLARLQMQLHKYIWEPNQIGV